MRRAINAQFLTREVKGRALSETYAQLYTR